MFDPCYFRCINSWISRCNSSTPGTCCYILPQLIGSRSPTRIRELQWSSSTSPFRQTLQRQTGLKKVGIPSDREQYIHRLRRTGHKGKDCKGILLLAPWEELFTEEIKDLPVDNSQLPELDLETKAKAEASMQSIDTGTKEAAYHAWLGYYNSISDIGRDKTNLVELTNKFCASISLQKHPPLFRKTALKMGVKDIPGVRIKK